MHGGVLSRSDGAVRSGRDDPASDWKNQLPQQCCGLEGPVGCTHGERPRLIATTPIHPATSMETRGKLVRRMSVLLEKRSNGVAVVTLNRPQVLNALDVPAKERLGSIWQEIADDPDIRVAILTGAGEKAFCAGSDIKEINRTGRMVTTETLLHAIPGVGVPLVKPVIAALHGYCIGMGMTLALHCDLRLAAKNAVLGYPEVRHGMISAVSALHLPQVIPSAQALEMLLVGRNISAEEAWRWGLVILSWTMSRPRQTDGPPRLPATRRRRCRPPSAWQCSRDVRRTRSVPKSKPCERWLRRTTITRKARPHSPAADDDGFDAGSNVPRLRRSGGARTGRGRSSRTRRGRRAGARPCSRHLLSRCALARRQDSGWPSRRDFGP